MSLRILFKYLTSFITKSLVSTAPHQFVPKSSRLKSCSLINKSAAPSGACVLVMFWVDLSVEVGSGMTSKSASMVMHRRA